MPVFEYRVGLRDVNEFETFKTYETLDLADFATARASADALLVDILALTDAHVFVERLTQIGSIAGSAAASSNVYERIDATLILDGGLKKANHKFPSPTSAAFVGNALNTASALWTAYLTNFVAGTGDWTLSDGEQLNSPVADATEKGRRVFTRGG
jgi:hypothetical protein